MFILFGSVILLLGINSKEIIIYINSASLEKKISAASKPSPHRNVAPWREELYQVFLFFVLLTAVTPVIKQDQA